MKATLVAVLLGLAHLLWGADALILISPEATGSSVLTEGYSHGEWLLWPSVSREDGNNRLLSLLSGVDWSGTGHELSFGFHEGRYTSSAFAELKRQGYFRSRGQVVEGATLAVGSSDGLASPAALLLALDLSSPVIEPFAVRDAWPPVRLVVAEAQSWDEVASISAKAGGKTLVVEYPPRPGVRWSRFWMQGRGWLPRVPTWPPFGVPGLIPAREAGDLLFHDEVLRWEESEAGNWGGANKWLAFVALYAPISITIASFLAAFFAGCTVYLISCEEPARFASIGVKYLLLVPASFLLAGGLTRAWGMELATLWFVLAFALLVVLSQLLGFLLHKFAPQSHFALPIFLAGLMTTSLSLPVWSIYSNVFGQNVLPVSPEAVGALFGYLVGFVALSRGTALLLWLSRGAALLFIGWGLADSWWVGDHPVILGLPFVALIAAERWFRPWQLPVFALIPLADGRVLRYGFVWAPGNLNPTFDKVDAVNLARHVEFMSSLIVIGTLLLCAGVGLAVERYFFQEIRRTLRRDSGVRALFQAAALCGAMALLEPLLLYPAFMCAVGALFVLLADTARSL